MCGICGFANYRNEDLLKGMASRLAHRGPDEDGFFSDGEKVSLGVRRLKIIDLATGGQPIFNEDGAVTVVFNTLELRLLPLGVDPDKFWKFVEENYSWTRYAEGVEQALFDAVSSGRRA